MLRALHPRYLGGQKRAVLAGVQMPPAAVAGVVMAGNLSALRAAHRPAGVFHVHHHLALRQVQIDVGHSPRRLDAQNPGI